MKYAQGDRIVYTTLAGTVRGVVTNILREDGTNVPKVEWCCESDDAPPYRLGGYYSTIAASTLLRKQEA